MLCKINRPQAVMAISFVVCVFFLWLNYESDWSWHNKHSRHILGVHSFHSLNVIKKKSLFYCSANNKIVALKEIRLQEEEGAPFTAIREGTIIMRLPPALGHSQHSS